MAVRLQFGPFQLDPRSGELWRAGEKLRVQERPLKLLEVLLRRRGELVTRAELQKALWPEGPELDLEDGLNTAVRKLREALGDSADEPQYLETVPRRGYRWIAPVSEVSASACPSSPVLSASSPAPGPSPLAPHPSPLTLRLWRWLAAIAALAALAAAFWLLRSHAVFAFRPHDSVLIADLDNQTGEPRFDQGLDTALAVSLEQSQRAVIFSRDRLPAVLQLMNQPPDTRVTAALGREICEREDVRALIAPAIVHAGAGYQLSAELIVPSTGAVVGTYRVRAADGDHVLEALDRIAGEIRRDLGESALQARASTRPLPQVTTSSLTALQAFAQGRQQWHTGHYQAAVASFHTALADDPNFAMAHAALANADCSDIYDYSEAACRSEYALALAHPDRLTDRERLIIAANQASDTNDIARAVALYQDYLRRYPDDYVMLADYARLLRRHGRESEAIPIYQQLLRVAPDDSSTDIQLATAEASQDDSTAALQAYQRAFQIDPHWQLAGDINREYGFTLVRAGRISQAASAFDILVNEPSYRATGMDSLARLEFWQGQLARAHQEELAALAAERHVTPLTPARSHLLLAQIAAGGGDRAAATRELNAAMRDFAQIGPKVAWGSLVGQEWARLGEAAPAQRILTEIAPLAHANNREETGYVRLLRGEIALAQDHTAQAVDIFGVPSPEDGTSVEALNTEALARAYHKAGNLREAVAWYQQVVGPHPGYLGWEAQPRKQEAYYWLASDELTLGDRATARAALAPLLQLLQGADGNFALRQRALALAARIGAPN